MKNYLFPGLMSAVVFFNSCSSDDNDSTGKKLLPSKITTTYYDNPTKPETSIQTLEYDNQGQLIKVAGNGNSATFEYSNGRPIKVNYYNTKNQLEYYSDFYYTGSQLTQFKSIYTDSNSNGTTKYGYNTNGQLITSTLCQSEDCSHPSTTSYAYSGDNVSTETTSFGGTIVTTFKSDYSYDDKLSPYTNTNKYLRIVMGNALNLSTNNYITDKASFKNNGIWEPNETTTYTMEYNGSGLPVKAIGKGGDGNISVQYDYEYITK